MVDFAGKKLIVFGDSIMFGSGNGGFGVGEYLERDLKFTVKKYCVGGARVGFCKGKSWVVGQVREAVSNKDNADLIIFNGFTNDCCKSGDNEFCDVPLGEITGGVEIFEVTESMTFSECFESIAAAFKKYFNAKILFVRPHRMGRRGEKEQIAYGERAKRICGMYDIAVADIYEESGLDTFDGVQRDLFTADTYGQGHGDCTHPNDRGYSEKYMPIIEREIFNLFGIKGK